MAELQLDTTRVFVKGLPPSFTSDQLATHFGSQYQVTDAHVLPDRRIGFVGFHDNTSAQNAVKHFNRSYIRMSKISVDLAKPVEVKRDPSGQAVPVSKRNAVHPTRPREFNDNSVKKRKRNDRDDGELERGQNNPGQVNVASISNATAHTAKTEDDQQGDKENESETEPVAARSDSDWLRGKTSRLLDLVGPEEIQLPNALVDSAVEGDVEVDGVEFESRQVENNSNGDIDVDGRNAAMSVPNGRLFIRNLAFDVTDADLEHRFSQFGKLQEAHVLRDARKSVSKGLAFLQFSEPEAAENALNALDGVSFHGRLIHILPASDKREQGLTEYDISKMPLRKQKAIKRKIGASNATFSWNSLYMNPDAVISSIAERLGVSKSEILDPTSADAAVKQAHAETQLIAETKEYLRSQGVIVDAFKNKQRDDRVLLLKNFPFGTSEIELTELLAPFGQVTRFIMPPAGTMALALFAEPHSASQALKQLAYKNVKGSVLYLEKAPSGLLTNKSTNISAATAKDMNTASANSTTVVDTTGDDKPATLFVRNLNFTTTTARLIEAFEALPGFKSARVKTRVDPKRPGEILSMGFGFVEFLNKVSADAALKALHGHKLDGHDLVVQISSKSLDLGEERRREDIAKKRDANQTKIIIKNLPFQASKKDVRALFSPYGQLKTVRVPKKFDSSSRGFGFAEFVTAREAENAMDALSNTHLLGRRLVLDFTQEEEIDPEEQIQAMERKMEAQNHRIQLSKLTTPGRKKFVIGIDEDQV